MIRLIVACVIAVAAFGAAGSDTPLAPAPTTEPANHANPGYQPCSKSTDGVKGRIRAVPVDPQEKC